MKRYLMICFIVLQIISVNLVAVGNIYQQHGLFDTKVNLLSTHKHHHNHNNTEHTHKHSHTINIMDPFIEVANIIDIIDFSRANYYPLKHWLINPQSKELFRPPIS